MSAKLKVIYEDNHLLVVSKPAGMPVQEDASGDKDLLSMSKDYVKVKYGKPGRVYLGLVHRLDRPASGVLVLARTSKAAKRLSSQFRLRSIAKRYAAVVEGRLLESGDCRGYIAKIGGKSKLVSKSTPGAKYAELSWRTVGVLGSRSLISVNLKTGRSHQIRLQLAELGHPIVGDFRHGATSTWDGRNLALHAYALALRHPTTSKLTKWFDVPDDWPQDWRDMIESEVSLQRSRTI